MFEEFLAQAFERVSPWQFFLNMGVIAVLAGTLALFYTRFGNAISNRRRFAMNFLPLALTTMLIITIVRSSIALSLGLVGALSIVRFRSAIKDPEELVYLFFTIAIGLAAGANQIIIAVGAFLLILVVLGIQAAVNGKWKNSRTREGMFLNITTSSKDLEAISKALGECFSYLELRRIDETTDRLEISFVIGASSLQQIEQARQKMTGIDSDAQLSFVEQPKLVL